MVEPLLAPTVALAAAPVIVATCAEGGCAAAAAVAANAYRGWRFEQRLNEARRILRDRGCEEGPGKKPGSTRFAGTVLRRYVHGAGVDEPWVWYEGANVTGAARRFLHPDHQGSIVSVSDNAGALVAANAYDPYGVPASSNQGRFQYTGQIWLPELALYHYKARIYAPTLGRFLQTDPVGYRSGLNLYWYVANDPLNLTDPTGLYICQVRPAPRVENLFGLLSSGNSAAQCAQIDRYIAGIGAAASKLPQNSPERARLENIAGTYGERGVDNGVRVSAARLSAGVLGDARYDGNVARVRFDLEQINAESRRAGRMTAGAATGVGVAAHEGYHVVQRLTGQTHSNSYVSRYRFEVPAYNAQASVFRAEGVWGADITPLEEGVWIAQGARNSAMQGCAAGAGAGQPCGE